MRFKGRGIKILDFDIEARPLSYLGSDFTTAEPTAIAWAWIVNGKARGLQCRLLTTQDGTALRMLQDFREAYDEADMVTGHFVRGFDLPVLNGAMLDHKLGPLSNKLSHDTKNDLLKRKNISASQENLAAALGIRAPKIKMNQQMWREANRLTDEGLDLTAKRVMGDVRQHVQMRQRLLELGWLGSPRTWISSGHLSAPYAP